MLLGYTRVSTAGQDDDLQRRALVDAGVTPEHIYSDTASGATVAKTRPALARVLDVARHGDTVVVWRIDRLGRSLIDVLTTVEALTARGIGVRSISDNIDPSTASGRMMLGIMGTLAEYERALIRERVQAGVDAARARGVRMGRPAPDRAEVVTRVRMARRLIEEDGQSAAEAARLVGWSRATLYRHMATVPVSESPSQREAG